MLDDRQPQAGAPCFTRPGFIDTIEAFKKSLQMLGRDARAKIAHIKLDISSSFESTNLQLLGTRRVLQSVVNKVREHLMYSISISKHLHVWRVDNFNRE